MATRPPLRGRVSFTLPDLPVHAPGISVHVHRNACSRSPICAFTLDRYSCSRASETRSHKAHIPKALAAAAGAREAAAADTLFGKVHRLEDDARRLLGKAEAEGDLRAAIAATKTALDIVGLFQKILAGDGRGDGSIDPVALLRQAAALAEERNKRYV